MVADWRFFVQTFCTMEKIVYMWSWDKEKISFHATPGKHEQSISKEIV